MAQPARNPLFKLGLGAAVFCLIAQLVLLSFLVLLSQTRIFMDWFGNLWYWPHTAPLYRLTGILLLFAAAAAPVAGLAFGLQRWFRRWPALLAANAACLCVLVWVAWDDAAVDPLPSSWTLPPLVEDPANDPIVRLFGEYADASPKGSALNRAHERPLYSPEAHALGLSNSALFREYRDHKESYLKDREILNTRWELYRPVHAWLSQLASQAHLWSWREPGPQDTWSSEKHLMAVDRCISATVQQSRLLALEGHGDEALELLLPCMELSVKRSHDGHNLGLYWADFPAAVGFVLDNTPTSEALRTKVLHLLERVPSEQDLRDKALACYYSLEVEYLAAESVQGTPLSKRMSTAPLRWFLLKPNLTRNRIRSLLLALRDAQNPGAVEELTVLSARGGLKNILGSWVLLNYSQAAVLTHLSQMRKDFDALQHRLQEMSKGHP